MTSKYSGAVHSPLTTEKRFNLSYFFLYCGVITVFPVMFGNIGLMQVIHLLFFTLLAATLGHHIVTYLMDRLSLTGGFRMAVNIIFGTFILYPTLNFITQAWSLIILIAADFIILALLWYRKNLTWSKLTGVDAIVVLVFCFFVLSNHNWYEIISAVPIQRSGNFMDNYWFTALTASISDGNFSDSLYEEGVGVYHHILGIVPAAVTSGFTGIPTHVALWGIMIPFGILSACFAIFQMALFFMPQLSGNVWMAILYFGIFCFLIPINIKNLFNFQLEKSLWNTEPFTMPSIPPWNMVYVLSVLIFIYLFGNHIQRIKDMLVIAFLLCLVLLTKTTSFFNLMIFAGAYTFLCFWTKKFAKPFLAVLISIVPAILIIKFFYHNSSADFVYSLGYLPEYFSSLMNISGAQGKVIVMGYLIFFATMVIWFNLRLVGLFVLPRNFLSFNRSHFLLSVGATFIGCTIFCSLFRIHSYTPEGRLIDDSSFDLIQFFRSFFLYICLFGPIGLCYFLTNGRMSTSYKLTRAATSLWILVCVVLLFWTPLQSSANMEPVNNSWAQEVVKEIKSHEHKKLVIKSDLKYTGQYLAAYDIGPWYLTIKNREGGYTYSYENYGRLLKLDTLVDHSAPLQTRSKICREFHLAGVDVFVATPNTKSEANELEQVGLLEHIKNTNWLYRLKN